MSDYKALGGVSRSREDLNRVVHDAEKRLEGMEKEMAELQKQLKEQQDIVSRAEELRNAYNRESLKWERSVNLSLPPGSTYPIKRHVGEYTKGRGYTVQRHYPWLWTLPPPPPPPPAPAPAPAPAPRPKRKIAVSSDDDSSEEEKDEVAVTGERSWAERDRALRAKAIALDSCVDEVFRNFNVSIR